MAIDPHVRLATPQDEDEILNLCHMLHQENGLMEMDDDRVRSVLALAFQRKGGILGVIGSPGKIEGMIYLLLAQIWYSSEWHLEELYSYVHPDHRKSSNAKYLIAFAKRCAEEMNIPLIIGIISNTRTKAKVELYTRQLKEPSGAFFIHNAKWRHSTTSLVVGTVH